MRHNPCHRHDSNVPFPWQNNQNPASVGRAKARLQAAWAAALVNLNPIGRHLAAQTA